MYKSTPHFQGQKADFSSFLVKEVKFRPTEIFQKVKLTFLRMCWEHSELKKKTAEQHVTTRNKTMPDNSICWVTKLL